MNRKCYLWLRVMLISSLAVWLRPAFAISSTEACDKATTYSFTIFFPVNRSEVLPNYQNNQRELQRLADQLACLGHVDSIVIRSASSPDGPYQYNRRLAIERGLSAKRYLLRLLKNRGMIVEDERIRLQPIYENWEGLYSLLATDPHLPCRDQVLALFEQETNDLFRKEQLKKLQGGRPWAYILRQWMPSLRQATLVMIYAPPTTTLTLPLKDELAIQGPAFDSVCLLAPAKTSLCTTSESFSRNAPIALKTNLLYDLATCLNASVELPFWLGNQGFSVQLQHQFPWWRWGENRNEYCLRYLSTGGELRWWFGLQHDALVGYFIGLYASAGKWDIQWKRDFCYQGEHVQAGLTGGYSFPITKHLNLELSASVGYAQLPYRHYFPTRDYSQLIRDPNHFGTWHYFGPTYLGVSLVMPIYAAKKKGGSRS